VGDCTEIQEAICCLRFRIGSYPLNGSIYRGFDTLYVDDDQLEAEEDPRHWFQIDSDRDPPSSYPIAGRGPVVGIDHDGAHCDALISLEELTARVTFMRRKFRGYKNAWERQRNSARSRIRWMFTTEKAREKMGRAYPDTSKES
jgi:hypothetical protein